MDGTKELANTMRTGFLFGLHFAKTGLQKNKREREIRGMLEEIFINILS